MTVQITYLHHSGFTVETSNHYLVLDYEGGRPAPDYAKLSQPGAAVFVSHRHADHFSPTVFDWAAANPNLRLILSRDVPRHREFLCARPGETFETDGIAVRSLKSTDVGVAYLIRTDGICLYHAGDLNWWHWEGEPDSWNDNMCRRYQRELDALKGEKVDIAFIPVDPRLGKSALWGLDRFMNTVGAGRVFPMHFWDDYSIFQRLQEAPETAAYRDRIIVLQRPGQVFAFSYPNE